MIQNIKLLSNIWALLELLSFANYSDKVIWKKFVQSKNLI